MLGVSGCSNPCIFISTKASDYIVIGSYLQERKPFDSLREDRVFTDNLFSLHCKIAGRDRLLIESSGASKPNAKYSYPPVTKYVCVDSGSGHYQKYWVDQPLYARGWHTEWVQDIPPKYESIVLAPVTISTRLDTLVLTDELKSVGADSITEFRWTNSSTDYMWPYLEYNPGRISNSPAASDANELYRNLDSRNVCYALPGQIFAEVAVAGRHLFCSEATSDAFKKQLNLQSLPAPSGSDMVKILSLKNGEQLSLKLNEKSYLVKRGSGKPQPLDMYEASKKDSCVFFLELTKEENETWKSKISKPRSVEPIIELSGGCTTILDIHVVSIYPGNLHLELRGEDGKLAKTIDTDYTVGETISNLDMGGLSYGVYTIDKLPGLFIDYHKD